MTDYERHFNFLASISNPKDISEETINDHFRLLLSILPNNGKLYKYRSLMEKSFENTYNSLEKGYMWIGKASELNDDADSLFIGDPIQAVYKAVDYLFLDKAKLIYTIFKKCGLPIFHSYEELKAMPMDEMLLCFESETRELNAQKAADLMLKYCGDVSLATKYVRDIQEQTKHIIDNMGSQLKNAVQNFCILNQKMREEMHVFSMSESYDLSNMWGYYADSGKGFCIEYDYYRAKDLDSLAKWKLLNTHKVVYDDSPVELALDCLLEKFFFENDDIASLLPFTQSIMNQALRKEKCWEHEKEWRITLGNTDSMVPIDIVSGIIIDERSVHSANAQRLIRLCTDRKWSVKVRKCNIFQTTHSYEDYITLEANQ